MCKLIGFDDALNAVASQQRQFIQALFEERPKDHGANTAGMQIYRNNLRATAAQALSITFPTVYQLIGKDLFSYATDRLLSLDPPNQGDWAKWGNSFTHVLESLKQLEDYPYVADCACLDLAIHQTERAKDSAFNLSSANLLTDVELDDLGIELADTVNLLESSYPLFELWNAHHDNDKEVHITSFKHKITQVNFKQYILVYRPKYKAKICVLTESEYFWMTRLMRDKSVGKTLELLEGSDFSFEQWLPRSIEQNLLKSFYLKTWLA